MTGAPSPTHKLLQEGFNFKKSANLKDSISRFKNSDIEVNPTAHHQYMSVKDSTPTSHLN